MGLDQLRVLTVLKAGMHTLSSTPSLPFPPGIGSHRSSLAPEGHHIRAYPMQHVVNKAATCWGAANLISGHLVHALYQRHGTAGHNQGRSRAPKAADV